ncbi:MAG: ComEC/Rec2 family competence protein [Rubripirellula sp.]
MRIGQRFQDCRGRVLVVLDGRRDTLLPGDLIEVYGTLRPFQGPTNPGQRDLRPFYRRKNLQARIDVSEPDQILTRSSSQSWRNRVSRFVANTATKGRNLLLRYTSDETGPLAVALVLGQRDYVSPRTRDQLLVTGTAHLLSVSGMHLAIVVLLASRLATLLRFPLAMEVVWITGICLFYTALTGGRPPVMRASILVGTFLFAMWMKRTSQPLNTLSLAALILVVLNPCYVFSVGVQLSFLAVATLILCGRRPISEDSKTRSTDPSLAQEAQLRDLVDRSRPRSTFYLRKALGMCWQAIWFSGCVTAMSLPLVWYQFHVVSPISVFANVLLGPCLFVALAAGVTTVAVGMVYSPLAALPGSICDWTLRWMNWIIGSAAEMPYGHAWLPAPPGWWVVTFYIVIGTLFVLPRVRSATYVRYLWMGLWIIVAWTMATTKPELSTTACEATFLDVGHGTSVILRLPDERVWLYDCGRLGNDANRSRGIDEALWSLGVTRLDGIFLSHADADHFNALPGLLERFSVKTIVTPPGMLKEDEPALDPIRQAIRDYDVPVREVASETIVVSARQRLHVLHPPAQRLPGSDNANSLVLRLDCAGTCMILPGDLEPPGTESLINTSRPPPGGILMAPHHGSLRMNAEAVLHWARPRETIVSGGRRARNPEVRRMLARFGSDVKITANVGAIRVRISRNGDIDVQTWKDAPW